MASATPGVNYTLSQVYTQQAPYTRETTENNNRVTPFYQPFFFCLGMQQHRPVCAVDHTQTNALALLLLPLSLILTKGWSGAERKRGQCACRPPTPQNSQTGKVCPVRFDKP